MAPTLIIGLAALIIILLALYGFRPKYPYFARHYLLTKAELAFYKVLKNAIPNGFVIAPKVRLADIINCSDKDWARGYGREIAGKHIDFVLVDSETLVIKLAIELDDSTHQLKERKKRDEFVNGALYAAGVKFLRIETALNYDEKEIREEIEKALLNE